MSEHNHHLLTFVVQANLCLQSFYYLSYVLKDAEFQGLSENIKIILGQHGSGWIEGKY
jgi:hypothetical protein